MIIFDRVSIAYDPSSPIVRDLSLEICEGECFVLAGPTGSGKSTLLRAINGLVPRFSGGILEGSVSVHGRSTAQYGPESFADLVGYVGQDPTASFVTERVEDELAYVMENLGFAPSTMRRRVEEVLDLLDLHRLRHRPLTTLSLGERQRVAIGAVLTAAPPVLVLDEPTSALDPMAAEEVLAAISRLVHDLGITVVLAEHRLDRVLPIADRIGVIHPEDASLRVALPSEITLDPRVSPPLTELARKLKWSRIPLTVREGRRASGLERAELVGKLPPEEATKPSKFVARVENVRLHYGSLQALRGVNLSVGAGEIVALMGRNGAGKSSLLALLAGLKSPSSGAVSVAGLEPTAMKARERIGAVGLVPQNPTTLLYASTVEEECSSADLEHGLAAGSTSQLLGELLEGIELEAHPRDLSEGQRLVLALAVVLGPQPDLIALDEPTRGLDYEAKRHLAKVLARLRDQGCGILVATHDVELVAQIADRTVVLAEGEVVAEGQTRAVLAQSPSSTTQVGKVFYPDAWLTVDEVVAALEHLRTEP